MKLTTVLEKLQYTTIRIETRSDDGSYSDGTAFIYEYATQDNTYPFLITAKHLISDSAEGRITLLQGQNRQPISGKGYTLDIDSFSKLWFSHPDESHNIAVTPFVPFVKHVENSGISIYFQSVNENTVVKSESAESIKIGDEVVYVGYPENCWDRKTLLPVYRRGMLSSSYGSVYQGKKQVLLDSTVLRGSSGSPVFRKTDSIDTTVDGQLLGVLTNQPKAIHDDSVDSKETLIQDSTIETPMGLVIKIDVAVEAIVAYLKEKGFI
ncbi:MAG: serine protease [Gammaproteobacteria bacterium]|nr:serine protease [Gammaproteobacteria bacterium]